jgi:hemerythrin-like domain-containing protein
MSFKNRISQTLHDEHRSTVALMERLEQLILRHRRGAPPDPGEPGVAELLSDLASAVQNEVERHFAFEEDRLFTYLDAIGDAAIGAHLTDEHSTLRPLGVRIAAMARDSLTGGFDEGKWGLFCRLGEELSGRMLEHVQKEEMALLPLLEESMDADTEMRLYEEYTGST